jgi:hypothetical protein
MLNRGYRALLVRFVCALVGFGVAAAVQAEQVRAIDVTVTAGMRPFPARAALLLKLYEQGPVPTVLTVVRDVEWPPGATRIVRLVLDRPFEPARVRRFALAIDTGAAGTATWDVESAFVEWQGPAGRERLLASNLVGVVAAGRDLASAERHDGDWRCASDGDCSDGLECNGLERCAPEAAGADAHGCVTGRPMACPVNTVCAERRGCRGPAPSAPVPVPR